MRLLHLADLHLGKRVNGYNMLEDQAFALEQIIQLIKEKNVDVLLIAGDIYDQTLPSAQAMVVFDGFLSKLNKLGIKILMISGNHDSQERLSFASSLMAKSGLYIGRAFDGSLDCIKLEDEYGPINFYMLPYTRPLQIKQYFEDLDSSDFQSALENVIKTINLKPNERNVILTHQYIIGSHLSDSEELYLGGTEAISIDIYDGFDYVAMGHIHKKQAFRNGLVSYPGALLKYSRSESSYDKKIRIIDMKEKGNIEIEEHTINYLRDMREIKGYFSQILEEAFEDENLKDYIHITLYDQDEIYNAMNRLREVYPNIMSLSYDIKTSNDQIKLIGQKQKSKDPLSLFEEFYEERNNRALDDDKKKLVEDYMREIWGGK